ncbi:MAG: HAD family phosphatase [Spirochaetes bacterium]|nr:HAD family phosphatase [Spirochaetota bacterium]
MKIKGVVFDFNGTLFWDTHLHNEAWDVFLERNRIKLSNEEKNSKIHGRNNNDVLNTLFHNQLSVEEVNRLSREKESIYQNLCLQTEMKLAPGAEEFLGFLKSIKIPVAIATASEFDNIEFYFKHLGLGSFFEMSEVIYNDGSIRSKPDPQIFRKAVNRMGLMECETLVFEDSISGILAAEKAEVGGIIIVNSNKEDYGRWDYPQIRNFAEVDKSLFSR